MSSKYYREFNPNPLGKETGDCVVRAICAVTEMTWYEVYDIATSYARKQCCLFNSNSITESLLSECFNMKRCSLPKREKGKRAMTVANFCKTHPTGNYVLTCAHHLIGIVDGKYYDLYASWDNATVYSYYEYDCFKGVTNEN